MNYPELFKIKSNGAIEILGINIGYNSSYVYQELKKANYMVFENSNCVYINDLNIKTYKTPINIIFSKKNDIIVSFRIVCTNNNKFYADEFYNGILKYIRSMKNCINTIEYKNKSKDNIVLNSFSNEFIVANLFIQHGNNLDKNTNHVGLHIQSNVLRELKDDDLKNESVQIILSKYLKSYWKKDYEKPYISFIVIKRYGINIIKILILISIFIVLYMLALNGRYKNIGDELILDTWTKTTFDRMSIFENNQKLN